MLNVMIDPFALQVIGLVDCASEDNLDAAYQAFCETVKPYLEWAEAATTLSSVAVAAAAAQDKSSGSRRASISSRDLRSASVRPFTLNLSRANWKVPHFHRFSQRACRLCFAFEPRPEQLDVAHEEFKVIPNQDDEHINFYVKHLLLIDLVAPILDKLGLAYEAMPDVIDKVGANPALNQTPLDADAGTSTRCCPSSFLRNAILVFFLPQRMT